MTLKPWLPRIAANAGLVPPQTVSQPVDPVQAKVLLGMLGAAGVVKRLLAGASNATEYFLVEQPGDLSNLFVKIVEGHHEERQIAADAIARFVTAGGVGVSHLKDGFPRQLEDGRNMLAYSFVDGRTVADAKDAAFASDMASLGEAIGRLHVRLSEWPDASSVRRQSEQRRHRLDKRLRRVLDGEPFPGPVPGLVRRLVERYPDAFSQCAIDAQTIHGDLNPGNVLFDSLDKPILLDFEEAVSAWYAPLVELTYVLERFVWARVENDDLALEVAGKFVASYVAATGASLAIRTGALQETVEWLALRSFILMIESHEHGIVWPDTEWQKFEALVSLAQTRRPLLEAIEGVFTMNGLD